jgi:hypothetical protein
MASNGTNKETEFMRRLLMVLTVLGTMAGTLGFAAGTAHAADCFVDRENNNVVFSEYSAGDRGIGHFGARDEIVTVTDWSSNGRRTVLVLSICSGGSWGYYGSYNSGPDEGDYDSEQYDLNFKERRRVRFYVCERVSSGGWDNCGDTTYGHA